MFPSVWSTKFQYPPSARIIPIASAMETEHLVTQAHRSTPPLDMLRYTRNDELWHTKANDIAPKPAKMVGRTKTSLPDRSMSGSSLQARPAFKRQGKEKQHSIQYNSTEVTTGVGRDTLRESEAAGKRVPRGA